MLQIKRTDKFKKSYKKWIKKHPDLQDTFNEIIQIVMINPYQSKLKTHKLTGRLKGLWALSITYEYRIIFEFINENSILLHAIGKHDEVY